MINRFGITFENHPRVGLSSGHDMKLVSSETPFVHKLNLKIMQFFCKRLKLIIFAVVYTQQSNLFNHNKFINTGQLLVMQ